MRFHEHTDRHQFLLDLGKSDLLPEVTEDWKPERDLQELFIKKRKKLIDGMKSFRKSQDAKKAWRKHRLSFMRGIKRFHTSTKGKRFHRELGRFLATRTFSNGPVAASESLTLQDVSEVIKAICSAKTHAFIEYEFYMPVYEQLEYEDFIESFLPAMNRVEHSLHKMNTEIEEKDLNILFQVCEATALIKSLADKGDTTVDRVENMWKKVKASLIKQGHNEEDEDFFRLLVGILKNNLGLE